MASTTTLSAHLEILSVYLGFSVYKTQMIAQKNWIHIWKALIFLYGTISVTTLLAPFSIITNKKLTERTKSNETLIPTRNDTLIVVYRERPMACWKYGCEDMT